jgi:hypothetical protein
MSAGAAGEASNAPPWAAVGVALLASLFLLSQGLQPCDDAYITFRHARNLALHGVAAWNPAGDPVLGSTSPIFVFTLGALALVFGVDQIETIALGLNAVAHFAIVLLGFAVVYDLRGRQLPALLAAALVGFSSVNVFVFSLGFESAAFTAVLLAGLLAVRVRRDRLAVVLASAAPLLRPEGLLLTPLVWGTLLLARRIRPGLVAAYLVLPLLWAAFATLTYGSPVPQSIRAKQRTPAVYRPYDAADIDWVARLGRLPEAGASLWSGAAEGALFSSNLRRERDGLRHEATRWVALAGLLLWVAAGLRRRDGRIVYLGYPLGFLLLYAWIGRSEVWYYPSFVTVSLLVLFAACSHGLSHLAPLGRPGRALELAGTLGVFALLLCANDYVPNREPRADPHKGFVYAGDPRGRIWQRWERERFDGYRKAARLLERESGGPGEVAGTDTVLISEVGVFGYFYPGPVVDAIGLCSPEALAFYPPPREDLYDARGEYRTSANTIIPSQLVQAMRPLYLVSSATYIPHLLEPGSAFLADYALVARTGEAWGEPILVFRRTRDDPRLPLSDAFEEVDESLFSGHPGPRRDRPWDVIASDLDLDGDPDLLVNWHHLYPLELYENRAGRFERINRPGRDTSGLYENRGIPELYADAAEVVPRIEASSAAGLYLWHDPERAGSWHFVWRDPGGEHGALALELEANLELEEIEGLGAGELGRPEPRRARIALEPGAPTRHFRVKGMQAGSQLKLRAAAGGSAQPPALFVGPGPTRVIGGALELWLPDPHGMAWVDVEGSRHPELFVTRGGMRGGLRPPLDPKRDRYYVHRGGGEPLYRMADPGTIPPGYGRGRRVEWVDVDLDGSPELSIANLATPNSLLGRDAARGAFRERATELGLDLEAEVGAWGDLEGDGLPDFFYLRGSAIDVARNPGGARFERVAGETLGLVLPPAGDAHRFTSLRWADFDNDGDLDLFAVGYAQRRSNHLFVRDGPRFRDASQEVELARVRGSEAVVFGDFDNDSFVDAVSFGRQEVFLGSDVPYVGEPSPRLRPAAARGLLWHNRGGLRFEFAEVPLSGLFHAATGLDADGDGRLDVAVVGGGRALLRNAAAAGGSLRVVLRDGQGEPIGALVQAHYGDGKVSAQRYGSAHNTAFSQVLQPLAFGIPDDLALERISVRWPGEQSDVLFPVRDGAREVVLERAARPDGGSRR